MESFFQHVKKDKKWRWENGEKVFFTSDTHFYHDGIRKFCDRPFSSVEEMNETMIKNWNNKVGKDGVVFHLGDFMFGGADKWNEVVPQLNGKIHLIVGNHDLKNMREGYMKWFESVSNQRLIYVEGRAIYLSHFPFLCYGGSYRGGKDMVWQLFGHVHTRSKEKIEKVKDLEDEEVKEILGRDFLRLKYLLPTQYDVGVDQNGFTPISFKEVEQIINKQIEEYGSR